MILSSSLSRCRDPDWLHSPNMESVVRHSVQGLYAANHSSLVQNESPYKVPETSQVPRRLRQRIVQLLEDVPKNFQDLRYLGRVETMIQMNRRLHKQTIQQDEYLQGVFGTFNERNTCACIQPSCKVTVLETRLLDFKNITQRIAVQPYCCSLAQKKICFVNKVQIEAFVASVIIQVENISRGYDV